MVPLVRLPLSGEDIERGSFSLEDWKAERPLGRKGPFKGKEGSAFFGGRGRSGEKDAGLSSGENGGEEETWTQGFFREGRRFSPRIGDVHPLRVGRSITFEGEFFFFFSLPQDGYCLGGFVLVLPNAEGAVGSVRVFPPLFLFLFSFSGAEANFFVFFFFVSEEGEGGLIVAFSPHPTIPGRGGRERGEEHSLLFFFSPPRPLQRQPLFPPQRSNQNPALPFFFSPAPMPIKTLSSPPSHAQNRI